VTTTPPAGSAPEQAVHDIGTGQVVVNRAGGDVAVNYTGKGPFRITRELRNIFRAIFDRADEAEKVIADVATTGVDAAETAAAAATGNAGAAIADAEKTVVEGDQVAHDVGTAVHDVQAERAALDAGTAVPAETAPAPAAIPAEVAAALATVEQFLASRGAAAPAPAPAAPVTGPSPLGNIGQTAAPTTAANP
jgi:hypothetical protein